MAIQTTVVGSYPIPRWLYGDTSKGTLRDAVAVVLHTQERAGIDVVADGELNRFDPSHPETNGMIDYFVSQFSGVHTKYSVSDLDLFQADAGMAFRTAPAGVVTQQIGEGTLNLPADYEFVRDLASKPLKFTCTGPHMLTKTLTDRHYGSREDLCMAVAGVLRSQLERIPAEVIQLDEANITGHPEESEWAAAALNHVLDGVKTRKGVHLCFGNYGGQQIQSGIWKDLLPYLNALHCDFFLLEFARRGYEELHQLKDLNPRAGIGLSVIDIKDNEVETPDLIASRIEEAATILGEERIHFVNPDCGFWMLSRSVADRKMQALVAGRDLYQGPC
jgi:5-methyltetrahydropteroyltriglutamate--homocysteine methyltransferase